MVATRGHSPKHRRQTRGVLALLFCIVFIQHEAGRETGEELATASLRFLQLPGTGELRKQEHAEEVPHGTCRMPLEAWFKVS